MRDTTKITIAVFFFICLGIVTVSVLFQRAERNEQEWTNAELSQLDQARGGAEFGLDDPAVQSILRGGTERGKEAFGEAFTASAVLIVCYSVILGLFIYRIRTKSR